MHHLPQCDGCVLHSTIYCAALSLTRQPIYACECCWEAKRDDDFACHADLQNAELAQEAPAIQLASPEPGYCKIAQYLRHMSDHHSCSSIGGAIRNAGY